MEAGWVMHHKARQQGIIRAWATRHCSFAAMRELAQRRILYDDALRHARQSSSKCPKPKNLDISTTCYRVTDIYHDLSLYITLFLSLFFFFLSLSLSLSLSRSCSHSQHITMSHIYFHTELCLCSVYRGAALRKASDLLHCL